MTSTLKKIRATVTVPKWIIEIDKEILKIENSEILRLMRVMIKIIIKEAVLVTAIINVSLMVV